MSLLSASSPGGNLHDYIKANDRPNQMGHAEGDSAEDEFTHSQSPSFASPTTKSVRTWNNRWHDNKGVILVLISEVFAACMFAAVRLLETSQETGDPMHPLQVLFHDAVSICTLLRITSDSLRSYEYHVSVEHRLYVVH